MNPRGKNLRWPDKRGWWKLSRTMGNQLVCLKRDVDKGVGDYIWCANDEEALTEMTGMLLRGEMKHDNFESLKGHLCVQARGL